jgi:hypothetical protein
MPEFSPSVFTFRDFMQKVLPTIIAICLFVPFDTSLKEIPKIEEIIFAGVILGYLIASPVRWLADSGIKYLPLYWARQRDYGNRREWVSRNWNYLRLHSYLSKEESDQIEEDGSLIVFYRVITFFLLIYFGLNLWLLINAFDYDLTHLSAISTARYWRDVLSVLVNLKTPVLAIGTLPTGIILPVIFLLIVFGVRESLEAYKYVFLEEGKYANLADRYQIEKGGIAVSIWGQVLRAETNKKDGEAVLRNPVEGATVMLLKGTIEIDKRVTSKTGYFQFENRYKDCLNATCTLCVKNEDIKEDRTFTDKTASGFEFVLPVANAPPDEATEKVLDSRT